jgi:uncharacterized membrane protein YbaN (DUF454 family)
VNATVQIDTLFYVVGALLIVIGLAGAIVPVLPAFR